MIVANPQTLMSDKTTGFLAKKHKLFIDGVWREPLAGKTLPVFDPATGQTISHVAAAEGGDVDQAVIAARKAIEEGAWSRMNGRDRAKLLLALADKVEALTDELAELESLDTGRALYELKLVDIPGAHAMLRYMAGWADKINGETLEISTPFPGDFHTYTVHEPLGVIAVILPWNYPFELLVWRVAPALAAGCTVVIKPAEQTPLSALRFAELVEEVGFPAGVVNLVTGFGKDAGAPLASHSGIDGISFTGSTQTGKNIVRAATPELKRVFLELGGKSPMIVFDDADLELTIPSVAGAIFFSAGQMCTAGSRIFVHERIYDKVLEGVAAYGQSLRLGHGLDPNTQLGPVVSKEQHEKILRYIEEGSGAGATIFSGGRSPSDTGYFIEPTVITDVKPTMSVFREEIFGPVLCALKFNDDSIDDMVRSANDSIYGLQASVWTQNLRKAHMTARRIKAGNVCINVHNFFDPAFPQGGYKQSGWGRGSGKQGIEHYTELKAVVARL